MLRLIATLLALGLAACASSPPAGQGAPPPPLALRLAPAALGGTLVLDQRLEFTVGGQVQAVDARLEADAATTRVLLHRHGRPLLRLAWDGEVLDTTRADEAPASLDPVRILDDVQLVYWPADAIRAALPADGRLEEIAGRRRLFQAGEGIATVHYEEGGRVRLEQHRLGYVLVIDSREAAP